MNTRVIVMGNESVPRRRGRPRSFDTNEAVAKAALLFWAQGYEGVSVDQLTTAMGITTQSFYAAFGSKKKVHEDALAWYEREVTRPVRDALTGEKDVARAIRNTLEASARLFAGGEYPLGCMRSTAGIAISRENEEIAHYATDQRMATVAIFKARLDQGIADDQIESTADTRVVALYLNAVIVGMAVAARDGVVLTDLLAMADIGSATLEHNLTVGRP
jgi:AcrR family transcriptional regulator